MEPYTVEAVEAFYTGSDFDKGALRVSTFEQGSHRYFYLGGRLIGKYVKGEFAVSFGGNRSFLVMETLNAILFRLKVHPIYEKHHQWFWRNGWKNESPFTSGWHKLSNTKSSDLTAFPTAVNISIETEVHTQPRKPLKVYKDVGLTVFCIHCNKNLKIFKVTQPKICGQGTTLNIGISTHDCFNKGTKDENHRQQKSRYSEATHCGL